MNTNTNNQNITSFLTLKNNNGDVVYSINTLGDSTLLISTQKPTLNIFDTLTLCDANGEICEINIGREITNILAYSIQRKMYDEEENEEKKEQMRFLLNANNNIVFRDIDECFPDIAINHGPYQQPDGEQIIKSLDMYSPYGGMNNA